MDKQKRLRAAIDIILFTIFLSGVVYATVKLWPEAVRLAHEPQKFSELLDSFGWKSIPVFVLIQSVQVIIAAIPGEFVQIAGGYMYGAFAGTLYSLTGIMLGSFIVFAVTRLLGYSLVKIFVSQKNLDKFNFMMNSSKSEIITFLLFLIPGMPKDILTYIAGLTPVKPLRFFTAVTIARFPALFASSIIGANIENRNYAVAIILGAAAVILFLGGLFFKDRIIVFVHRSLHRQQEK